ncbi:hypothetical protein FACS189421_13140 [Bacteroidia bacterium]|nr:hypothetical protein FACS189421_13140 [Bacteroidia bacterium]GHT47666.1 hypothetical protein FACS189440_08860 [Bacteroidia bacterium]
MNAKLTLTPFSQVVAAPLLGSLSVPDSEDIVAYTANRMPLSRQQYIDSIREAQQSIAEGNFVTHEEAMRILYTKYGR